MNIQVERTRQSQAWFVIPVSLALAVFGFFFLQKFHQPILGWPIVGLFGVVIPIFALAQGGTTERVLLNDSGILDETLGIGTIAWADIVDVHTESKYNNFYLCLKLKNSQKYLSKLPPWRRKQFEQSRELGFTRFNVEVSAVEQDLYYLLDVIQKRIKG